jgi:hypothetical protein
MSNLEQYPPNSSERSQINPQSPCGDCPSSNLEFLRSLLGAHSKTLGPEVPSLPSEEIIREVRDAATICSERIARYATYCRDEGPTEVQLPRPNGIGAMTVRFCSAELNNPKLLSCQCGFSDCIHKDTRISGIVGE